MGNPDQALLRRFAGAPLAVDSNPLAAALAMEVHAVDPLAGRIVAHFQPGDQFLQGGGAVQGGAVATMADFAMAFAALAMLGEPLSAATVNLNMAFLRPARAGMFVVEGQVDRRGRSLIYASARVIQEGGLLIATASSTLCILSTVSRDIQS